MEHIFPVWHMLILIRGQLLAWPYWGKQLWCTALRRLMVAVRAAPVISMAGREATASRAAPFSRRSFLWFISTAYTKSCTPQPHGPRRRLASHAVNMAMFFSVQLRPGGHGQDDPRHVHKSMRQVPTSPCQLMRQTLLPISRPAGNGVMLSPSSAPVRNDSATSTPETLHAPLMHLIRLHTCFHHVQQHTRHAENSSSPAA